MKFLFYSVSAHLLVVLVLKGLFFTSYQAPTQHAVLLEADTVVIANQTQGSRQQKQKNQNRDHGQAQGEVQKSISLAPVPSESFQAALESENVFQTLTIQDYKKWVSTHNPAPEYPRLSRIRGDQGKVVVRVSVQSQGQAQTVLESSSGFETLDQAALDCVRGWKFPNFRGAQQEITLLIPFQFSLD